MRFLVTLLMSLLATSSFAQPAPAPFYEGDDPPVAKALALDEKMPHADRKLPQEIRDALEALRAESR